MTGHELPPEQQRPELAPAPVPVPELGLGLEPAPEQQQPAPDGSHRDCQKLYQTPEKKDG